MCDCAFFVWGHPAAAVPRLSVLVTQGTFGSILVLSLLQRSRHSHSLLCCLPMESSGAVGALVLLAPVGCTSPGLRGAPAHGELPAGSATMQPLVPHHRSSLRSVADGSASSGTLAFPRLCWIHADRPGLPLSAALLDLCCGNRDSQTDFRAFFPVVATGNFCEGVNFFGRVQ